MASMIVFVFRSVFGHDAARRQGVNVKDDKNMSSDDGKLDSSPAGLEAT
jgi:hypothetical protein